MEKNTKKLGKIKFKKWFRLIHRYLGFFFVGLCIIYGVSGVLLNHISSGNPAYKTVNEALTLDQNMTKEELTVWWKAQAGLPDLKRVGGNTEKSYRVFLDGGIGTYYLEDGNLTYEHHTKRQIIYWINQLHYNKVGGWTYMADFFAASLIFFAVSGFFMVSKKNLKKGLVFVAVGVLVPILFLIFG